MNESLFAYCKKIYTQIYEFSYKDFLRGKNQGKHNVDDAERYAQKCAIRESLKDGVKHFPLEDVSEIWKTVYKVHIYRKSGLEVDEKTVAKVISAEQSWRKSSGHAFEELIKEMANLTLAGSDVEIILQKDLNILLKASEIANEPRDIAWLEKMVANSIFDLYAVTSKDGKKYVYGCIQSKTSVRDRVTRDREPSIHAMQSFFWSICVALDGDFLRMPKFQAMVNGGSTEFPENGWHGMYVLSDIENDGRIYHTSFDLDIMCRHAVEAASYWKSQRQWFNHEWIAK